MQWQLQLRCLLVGSWLVVVFLASPAATTTNTDELPAVHHLDSDDPQEEECRVVNDVDENAGDSKQRRQERRLQEFPVVIHNDLTLHYLQASSAFSGVQHDETGTVLWGASVCLARYLQPHMFRTNKNNLIVLELGCGCGLPSIVAAKYLMYETTASRVIATDMEDGTLQQLDQVAALNNCQEKLELYKMNWYDNVPTADNTDTDTDTTTRPEFQADIVLASDVIYSDSMVEPLVHTIRKYLTQGGTAYLSLRNTRQGVERFWQDSMPNAGFVLVETISCAPYLPTTINDELPPGFQQENQGHRWRGDHTIYVYSKNNNKKTRQDR